MIIHKTLDEILALPAGTYQVGIYAPKGCIGCVDFVEPNKDTVDFFVNLDNETNVDFNVYTFLPPGIPQIITINK